jgi:RNA polymerase sigma-70 factor (ECF subfamily)
MNKKEAITDGKLVLEYQSGNIKALAVLVKRWHKSFCEKAFWILKDADLAKDIAQDSWKTIIDKIHKLENPESFGYWASRIMYTKSMDALRAKQRQNNFLDVYKNEKEQFEEAEADNEQIKKEVLKAIKCLPQNQQIVLQLFYVQSYSLKEVSKILEISIGTTKSRLFHAREKLKKTIKYKDYEY